jgi:uracil-DNA glycosylase
MIITGFNFLAGIFNDMFIFMTLIQEIRKCSLCLEDLPLEPKPILQFSKHSKILIVSQAPGRLAHESGIPWNDKSGERLRSWLAIESVDFYIKELFAIVPMGFCYPGKGVSGDLPPRKECRARWLDLIMSQFTELELIILIGQYAVEHFLGKGSLKNMIKEQSRGEDAIIVIPHPSPRNNIWLAKNDWFEISVLPSLREKIKNIINDDRHGPLYP